MRTDILGIGTALPCGSLTQDQAVGAAVRLRGMDPNTDGARTAHLLHALYRRSGVQKRHSILLRDGDEDPFDRQTFYRVAESIDGRGPTTGQRMQRFEETAPGIASQACQQALSEAQTSAQEIRHLVTVSCSGFAAPGFDLSLYTSLGLSPQTSRTHVGFMGCHGALNGLRVARALAISNPGRESSFVRRNFVRCTTNTPTIRNKSSPTPCLRMDRQRSSCKAAQRNLGRSVRRPGSCSAMEVAFWKTPQT